jgi:hypothetical protein
MIPAIESDRWFGAAPPSYEQCVAAPTGTRADYVATPLAMAALLTWEDDDD